MRITNNTPGLRGVSLKDGTTHWIEPGASHTFDKDDVSSVHADLDEGAAKAKPEPEAKTDAAEQKNKPAA